MTMLPDQDPPTLQVVPNPDRPSERAATAVRDAVAWVSAELERLRRERAERDRDGLAEIETMRRKLIDDREQINAEIKTLVAEQIRLTRVLRALDR